MVNLERDICDGIRHEANMDALGIRALDRAVLVYVELAEQYVRACEVRRLYTAARASQGDTG